MRHLIILILLLFCFGGLSAGPISTTIDIEFIHPGDDGTTGTADVIDWYWSVDSTTGWTFISGLGNLSPAGTIDTVHLQVTFPDNGSYWIGAIAMDEAGNTSEVCVLGRVNLPDMTGPSCVTGTIIGVTRQ